MTIKIASQSFLKYSVVVSLIVALTACGGGGGGGGGTHSTIVSSSALSSKAASISSTAISSEATSNSSNAITSASGNTSSSAISSVTATISSSAISSSSSVQVLDTTPDTFSFTAATNAALSTDITSNSVTISGINTQADIIISGGLYSVDGGAFTSASGKVNNGQQIVVKVTSSATPASDTQATLTVGGVSNDFSVTTEPVDTTPNPISFTDFITANLNSLVSSNTIKISGINTATSISIVNGQYSIDGGAFTNTAGMVSNGQTVTVKATSAVGINSTTQAVLTVGGVKGTFSVITTLQNTTPYLMGGSIQGSSLNIAAVVNTLAGTAPGVDGIGSVATFNQPNAIVRDGNSLYVSDTQNQTIRKIDISTGSVTTLAGNKGVAGSADGTGTTASFYCPVGITTDGTSLYVADSKNHTIRKIDISTGAVTTLAGRPGVSGNADGTGTAALFYNPAGITTDGPNLYVTDSYNHTIRKIVISTGAVTTLAGTAGASGSADGTGAAASFKYPVGITIDGTHLYVADTNNYTIRKIVIATGAVTTLAGKAGVLGGTDGTGASARFDFPRGITTDGINLYVANTGDNTVRKIVISTSVVTTLAGGFGSSDGTGLSAHFNQPVGITNDGNNLYVADTENNTIRKIGISSGTVITIAGASIGADGIGAAARFYQPVGITTDGSNLYVSDTNNHTIRQIVISTGFVTTLAGKEAFDGDADGTGAAARFTWPRGITTDGTNLYVADTNNHSIRKIVISTGAVTTLAGNAGVAGSADGTGTTARFYGPVGITTDNSNLYVVDTSNHTIRKIDKSTGVVTTLAGTAGAVGSADGTGSAARFEYPQGITTDGTNLYVADTENNTIRKIVISTGAVTLLAGKPGASGSTDGIGADAKFNHPDGITTDGTNLYVADTENNTIRKIVISTGAVTTLANTTGAQGSADGVGAAASFYNPFSITTNGFDLFLTDTNNNTIRKIH